MFLCLQGHVGAATKEEARAKQQSRLVHSGSWYRQKYGGLLVIPVAQVLILFYLKSLYIMVKL